MLIYEKTQKRGNRRLVADEVPVSSTANYEARNMGSEQIQFLVEGMRHDYEVVLTVDEINHALRGKIDRGDS